MKGLQPDDRTGRYLSLQVLFRNALVIPERDDIGCEFAKDKEEVLFQVAEDDPHRYARCFHVRLPAVFIVLRPYAFYPCDRLVPRDNDNEFVSESLCLKKVVDVTGMEMIEGACADDALQFSSPYRS